MEKYVHIFGLAEDSSPQITQNIGSASRKSAKCANLTNKFSPQITKYWVCKSQVGKVPHLRKVRKSNKELICRPPTFDI